MLSLAVRLYDAFATNRFGGNVAGVVLVSDPAPDTAILQLVARELAAPTTGVVWREGHDVFSLRFFTPTQEIEMCGHVIVGVGAALMDDGLATPGSRLVFQALAGAIPVELSRTGGCGTVTMTQRPPLHEHPPLACEEVCTALRIRAEDLAPNLPVAVASTSLRHLVIPVRAPEVLDDIAPDFVALAELCRRFRCETAPVVSFAAPGDDVAWRLRDFCPAIGNDEESASGTTNGAVGCYAIANGVASVSPSASTEVWGEQGVAMGRPSHIRVGLACDGQTVRRVTVTGQAIRTLRGEMSITDETG